MVRSAPRNTPGIVRRIRPAFVMTAGLALAAVGLGVFIQVDATSGLAAILLRRVRTGSDHAHETG